MTFDERNMMGQVSKLTQSLGRAVKKFKTDADGMLVEGVNGRSVYFVPDGSVLDTVTWKAYENDGSEISNKAGSVRMIAGWEGPVKKMLMGVFSRKEARIRDIAAKLVGSKESRAEELALALVRKGSNVSETVIVASTACERCMKALAYECELDWGVPRDLEGEEKTGCDFCRGGV
jgi:hypothetical protein